MYRRLSRRACRTLTRGSGGRTGGGLTARRSVLAVASGRGRARRNHRGGEDIRRAREPEHVPGLPVRSEPAARLDTSRPARRDANLRRHHGRRNHEARWVLSGPPGQVDEHVRAVSRRALGLGAVDDKASSGVPDPHLEERDARPTFTTRDELRTGARRGQRKQTHLSKTEEHVVFRGSPRIHARSIVASRHLARRGIALATNTEVQRPGMCPRARRWTATPARGRLLPRQIFAPPSPSLISQSPIKNLGYAFRLS